MRLDELTRGDFPILARMVNGHPLVYLDSAASSQKPRAVHRGDGAVLRRRATPTSHRSIHTLGEEATELYEAARDRVQRFIGARSREEVVLTRGTTDGISLVGRRRSGHTLRPGDEILVTDMEHHSNIIPWQMAARDPRRDQCGPSRSRARWPPSTSTRFDELLGPRTRVVAFAHVSNVLGTDQPGRPAVRARARGGGGDGRRRRSGRSSPARSTCPRWTVTSTSSPAHKMLGPDGHRRPLGPAGGARARWSPRGAAAR
mgnify:CR=1 FL=1